MDDGSTAGTADIAADLGLPDVRVIRQADAGKPAALISGVRNAGCDIVVMTGGDTVFEPGTVRSWYSPSPTRVSARSRATPRSATATP